MNTTNEATTPAVQSLSIRGESGGMQFNYLITKDEFLSLAGKVFAAEMESSRPENAKSGGAISGFLHAYGMTGAKVEKAGIQLEKFGWFEDEAGEKVPLFDEKLWLDTVYPVAVELTPEQKKELAAKRALTAKQAAWDKSVAPWIKKGMTVEELSHEDLYGPRPA